MKMASCAASVVSVLSSRATEKAMKTFILFIDWPSKCTERSKILSAMVFLERLTLAKARRSSGHMISAAFTMHVFMNLPSPNGFEATVIFLAMR